MSQIRDEVKREVPSRPHVTRSTADSQRAKLEKLMKNPDKPVIIPEKPKTRGPPVVPDFVRNVMGSSAGAGSGEFHVYRHLRRKEYARQHFMDRRAAWEKLESEYHDKLEENKQKADEATAKKRAKRLRKKQNQRKGQKKPKKAESDSDESESSEEEKETENEDISRGNTEVQTSSDKNTEDLPTSKETKLEIIEKQPEETNTEKNDTAMASE